MKFYGLIGFVTTEETEPGIWTQKVEERKYYGNVVQNNRRWTTGESVNDNFVLNNQLSIVSDAYLEANFPAIRYVKYMGSVWKVTNATINRPRIVLSLGEVYNGDTVGIPPSTPEEPDSEGEPLLPTPGDGEDEVPVRDLQQEETSEDPR